MRIGSWTSDLVVELWRVHDEHTHPVCFRTLSDERAVEKSKDVRIGLERVKVLDQLGIYEFKKDEARNVVM